MAATTSVSDLLDELRRIEQLLAMHARNPNRASARQIYLDIRHLIQRYSA